MRPDEIASANQGDGVGAFFNAQGMRTMQAGPRVLEL